MDFSMKNSKFVNKYFSELMDRSNAAPMEIIADGTQANENPAACYRGFGCVSANNSSRLLLDYKAEHPQAYEEIMRLLFQKNYGACLTHIKLELVPISTLLPAQSQPPSVLPMSLPTSHAAQGFSLPPMPRQSIRISQWISCAGANRAGSHTHLPSVRKTAERPLSLVQGDAGCCLRCLRTEVRLHQRRPERNGYTG